MHLGDGALFIHSPTPLSPELRGRDRKNRSASLDHRSEPHPLLVDRRMTRRFPEADVYLVPRIREQAGSHIDFAAHDLLEATGYPWDRSIATLPVAGSYMTEFEFFHRASRTLVLTDIIENFEPRKLGSGLNALVDVAWRCSGSGWPDAPRYASDVFTIQDGATARRPDNDRLAASSNHSCPWSLVRRRRRHRAAPGVPLAP